jgi:hypothetical protein
MNYSNLFNNNGNNNKDENMGFTQTQCQLSHKTRKAVRDSINKHGDKADMWSHCGE